MADAGGLTLNAASYLFQGALDDIIAADMQLNSKRGCIAGSETISDACLKHIEGYCEHPDLEDEYPYGFQGCLDDLGMSRKQFECQVRRAFESYKQMFHREDVRTITIRGKSRSLGLFSQKNFMITRYVRESAHTLSALTCHMEWTELWFTEVFWKIVETLDQLITYETDTKVEHATVPRG